MATESLKQMPFKIDGDYHIFCVQPLLENHLKHVLHYSCDEAQMVSHQILEYFNPITGYYVYYLWQDAVEGMLQVNTLRTILQCMDNEQLLLIISFQDRFGYTVLHHSALSEKGELMRLILDSVCEEDSYQLLRITDRWGQTALHVSCHQGDTDSVSVILEHLAKAAAYSLLQTSLQTGDCPLHVAAFRGHCDVLKLFYQTVTEDQYGGLLRMTGSGGRTVLHCAAFSDQQTCIMLAIKDTVTPDSWLDLVSTPVPTDSNQYGDYKFSTAVSRIADLRAAAKIDKVLRTTDWKDQELQIQNITETESITVEQIQELSPHSSLYIIPYKQMKSKRYGLILYSSLDRQGSAEEAESLELALQAAGCDVMKMEWSDGCELHSLIDSCLDKVSADCALLVVSVMAHGGRGVVKGSAGGLISVNDILRQFTARLPVHTPMVMLIQACQKGINRLSESSSVSVKEDPLPTQLSDPSSNQHITLTRPHTVLLLATVRGGVAYRGMFTGAMANQFRCSDGRTDIYMMFTRAVSAMKKSQPESTSQQDPEFRAVTEKTLILPPSLESMQQQ